MNPALLAVLLLLSLLSAPAELPADPFAGMSGEEIRIAYCRGELDAEDVFLASDLAYVETALAELAQYYRGERPACPSGIDAEPLPDGVKLDVSLTLAEAELLAFDTRAEYPIQLNYAVGGYCLSVSFAPWDMFIADSAALAGVQWHPTRACFVPVEESVCEPDAQFGEIRVYLTDDGRGIWFKAFDRATGNSLFSRLHIGNSEKMTMTYNGASRVALRCGNAFIRVFDLSGALYYEDRALGMTPWVSVDTEGLADWLFDNVRWVDENTLEAEDLQGVFRFTVGSYHAMEIGDDGTVSIAPYPAPKVYLNAAPASP
ncbi:MAG: hypothetical protein IKD37_00895 [Clostridia bacterium]|nr:hypothetical protein [Clostridia bacterium]